MLVYQRVTFWIHWRTFGSLMRTQGCILQVCRARLCHFERFWHRPGIQEPWDLGVQRCFVVVSHFYVHLVWTCFFLNYAKHTSKKHGMWCYHHNSAIWQEKNKETRCCWSTFFAPSAGFGTRSGARGFVPVGHFHELTLLIRLSLLNNLSCYLVISMAVKGMKVIFIGNWELSRVYAEKKHDCFWGSVKVVNSLRIFTF